MLNKILGTAKYFYILSNISWWDLHLVVAIYLADMSCINHLTLGSNVKKDIFQNVKAWWVNTLQHKVRQFFLILHISLPSFFKQLNEVMLLKCSHKSGTYWFFYQLLSSIFGDVRVWSTVWKSDQLLTLHTPESKGKHCPQKTSLVITQFLLRKIKPPLLKTGFYLFCVSNICVSCTSKNKSC